MNETRATPPATPAEAELAALPPPRRAFDAVAPLVAASGRKVVVLDDDPTGTQTVHGFDVLTEWSEPVLAAALLDPRPCFFVLTNSRSLPEREAVALAATLAANLAAAARAVRRECTLISRSDSTLRGHFPAEIEPLMAAQPGGYDGVILAPAFFEAGRVTIGDVHYVREAGGLVPAGETEFARDATFGYRQSNLRQWIAEKSGGSIPASHVSSVPLSMLRELDGAERVRDHLLQMRSGSFVVVNAADYGDLEVFVHGLLLAEAGGRRFLGRTAASFVRVRAGVAARRLIEPAELRGRDGRGGLVVVGSFIDKTTRQLEAVLAGGRATALELEVGRLAQRGGLEAELARLAPMIDAALRDDRTVIVYTSRERDTALGPAGDLKAGRAISAALVSLVRSLGVRPRFLIAKGGITSSDIAVHALGIRRALILGQASPGVPVWRAGEESRWPGLTYIVFPGNVGDADTLRRLLERLGD